MSFMTSNELSKKLGETAKKIKTTLKDAKIQIIKTGSSWVIRKENFNALLEYLERKQKKLSAMRTKTIKESQIWKKSKNFSKKKSKTA
jgi:hypothetical protein